DNGFISGSRKPIRPSTMKWFLSIGLIWISIPGHTQEWKWAGFEVMGHHKIERTAILKHIPIQVGEAYNEDHAKWETWCNEIKNHFKFYYTYCSSVRYADFQAYFIIDIVEAGHEHRVKFR